MSFPWFTRLFAAVGTGVLLAACSSSPSTQAEVCSSFDELGVQALQGNAPIGNPLFEAAGDLGDVAARYEGGTSLATDAAALEQIAEADSTSIGELQGATQQISALCGHPLGTNALFGGLSS